MSNPYVVFAAVFTGISVVMLGFTFTMVMLAAFYPDDLNDHKDN